MSDTFFTVPEDKLARFLPNHAMNLQTGKIVTVPSDSTDAMRDSSKVTMFSGGGGSVSSTMDYMRVAEAMRNGGELDGVRILGPKTVDFMRTNHLGASITAGTVVLTDPVEEIVVISMIQLPGSPWPLRSDLKVATYQALLEAYE